MPTYDYICRLCGHELETMQSITAKPLVSCPACEEDGLRRKITGGAGIIFKGTGFYQTDYKNTSAPKTETTSSKPEGSKSDTSSGGSSTSTESGKTSPAASST